jgi:hypothetical protein
LLLLLVVLRYCTFDEFSCSASCWIGTFTQHY